MLHASAALELEAGAEETLFAAQGLGGVGVNAFRTGSFSPGWKSKWSLPHRRQKREASLTRIVHLHHKAQQP